MELFLEIIKEHFVEIATWIGAAFLGFWGLLVRFRNKRRMLGLLRQRIADLPIESYRVLAMFIEEGQIIELSGYAAFAPSVANLMALGYIERLGHMGHLFRVRDDIYREIAKGVPHRSGISHSALLDGAQPAAL